MIRPIILTIAFAVYHASALQCHVVPAGNLSLPDSSPVQECAIGSLTCVKVVDYTRGTYTKQCQTMNCTMNGLTNSVANCQNTSTFGVSIATCCCYGDGCNSAPKTRIITVIGAAVALASLVCCTVHPPWPYSRLK
uniref:Activin_recp domain-containing protein n=1 Tax=Caenorhabditis tropicalis TaxID=1561998 RepID=A0A1I7TSA4_9PELO